MGNTTESKSSSKSELSETHTNKKGGTALNVDLQPPIELDVNNSVATA